MGYLTHSPIDPAALLTAAGGTADGGVTLFAGIVRDHNEGKPVVRLEYSAYEAMAEKEMARIAGELAQRFPAARVTMLHRLGSLVVGDAAVVVVAAAAHREEAFAACRAGIEAIKSRVPIWKKEYGPDGSHWVEPCGHGGREHPSSPG